MTHQWKPGDRGRIEFEYRRQNEHDPDSLVQFDGDAFPQNWLSASALATAEFVAPAMPKPGEWTGPGLTPIYEVRYHPHAIPDPTVNFWAVTAECLREGVHRIQCQDASNAWIPLSKVHEWRRIGDSE